MVKYFAVTGKPVIHSASPELFRTAYPEKGEEWPFFRMTADSPDEARALFDELTLTGLNITAPFKEAASWKTDCRSQTVQYLSAANALYRESDGIYLANTDVDGVSGALQAHGVSIEGKRCVVLGAGGAGRAAAWQLHRSAGEVVILNRSASRAREAAARIGCSYAPLSDAARWVSSAEIIVHALYPGVDVVDAAWLQPGQVILDALYTGSAIREKALARECLYLGGEAWLLYQAIAGFRLFTGMAPNREMMKQQLEKKRPSPRHISLIGFMGAGKTTVGKALAERLNRRFIDTDPLLEAREGISIPELIRTQGEKAFREKEAALLTACLTDDCPSLIACGGGAVLSPHSRKQLLEHSLSIWLYESPEVCAARIAVDSRPLLKVFDDPELGAVALFERRKADYARATQWLVSCRGRSVKEVTDLIYEEVHTSF